MAFRTTFSTARRKSSGWPLTTQGSVFVRVSRQPFASASTSQSSTSPSSSSSRGRASRLPAEGSPSARVSCSSSLTSTLSRPMSRLMRPRYSRGRRWCWPGPRRRRAGSAASAARARRLATVFARPTAGFQCGRPSRRTTARVPRSRLFGSSGFARSGRHDQTGRPAPQST